MDIVKSEDGCKFLRETYRNQQVSSSQDASFLLLSQLTVVRPNLDGPLPLIFPNNNDNNHKISQKPQHYHQTNITEKKHNAKYKQSK